MAKTYINHDEVQNMLFGESDLDSKERDVKKVLKQYGIGDEFSYFEKILSNKTISDSEKISTFLESFDLSENSKYQIKNKLSEIMYNEEDLEEEIPEEETSEEPEEMNDNEDEDLEDESDEEDLEEEEEEEELEGGDDEINVSDMDLDSKLDLIQKVIDSVTEEDFEDFMNSLTDLVKEYEGSSEDDSEDDMDEEDEDSEEEEDYPDFDEEDSEDEEDLEEDES